MPSAPTHLRSKGKAATGLHCEDRAIPAEGSAKHVPSSLLHAEIRLSSSFTVSIPSSINEKQKLSIERIATYCDDPIHTLPQYTHNTFGASMKEHTDIIKPLLEVLVNKVGASEA